MAFVALFQRAAEEATLLSVLWLSPGQARGQFPNLIRRVSPSLTLCQ